MGREFQNLPVQGKKLFVLDMLVTSRNGNREIMQFTRIMSLIYQNNELIHVRIRYCTWLTINTFLLI